MEVNKQETCHDLTNCQGFISPNGLFYPADKNTAEFILYFDRKNSSETFNSYVLEAYNCVPTEENFKSLVNNLIMKTENKVTSWGEILNKCGYLGIHLEVEHTNLIYSFSFPATLTREQNSNYPEIFSALHNQDKQYAYETRRARTKKL